MAGLELSVTVCIITDPVETEIHNVIKFSKKATVGVSLLYRAIAN